MTTDCDYAETAKVEGARDALFEMLCRAPDGVVLNRPLDDEQWSWIGRTAREHRLGPLLHVIAADTNTCDWPDWLRDVCLEAHRRTRHRWLAQQGEMGRISEGFSLKGLHHVFLKGATLAATVYPDGAMRPLRDLDILVEPGDAMAAHETLATLGFAEIRGIARTQTRDAYQLPALRRPETGVVVEVHRSLCPKAAFESEALSDRLLDTAQMHAIFGNMVRLAEPSALYCHLILHAGIKSQFDCGPLILADLAYMQAMHRERWGEFGSTAESLGLGRSHALFTRLLDRYRIPSASNVDHYGGDGPLTVMADQAIELLTMPVAEVRGRQISRDLQESTALSAKFLRFLRSALEPTPVKISAAIGGDAASPLIWLRYPLWLANRTMLLLRELGNRAAAREARQDLRLQRWLKER